MDSSFTFSPILLQGTPGKPGEIGSKGERVGWKLLVISFHWNKELFWVRRWEKGSFKSEAWAVEICHAPYPPSLLFNHSLSVIIWGSFVIHQMLYSVTLPAQLFVFCCAWKWEICLLFCDGNLWVFFPLRESLASKVKKALKEKKGLQVIPEYLVIKAIQDWWVPMDPQETLGKLDLLVLQDNQDFQDQG